MLFNTYQFIFIFLPIVVSGYYFLLQKSIQLGNLWLALSSLFFYGYWSLYSLPILMTSICTNYFFSIKITQKANPNRKIFLILAILFNLGALCYFKYFNFFIENTNLLRELIGLQAFDFLDIVLPIGISFFTFTQLAFLIDAYYGKVSDKNFTNYLLFVTFFPHLIAGPLYHHSKIMPQFVDEKLKKIDSEKIVIGMTIFTIGLSKKVLLADTLGIYANNFFQIASTDINPNLLTSWLGSLAYTFQLYFDFSGYSDMAIGLGLMLGIWLPINFYSPFKATNIIDFWQRWHISLTKYIGMYIFNPLVLKLMRINIDRSKISQNFFTMIVPNLFIFLILGIWHGASWTFVIFGLMHGFFIVINRLWRSSSSSKKTTSYFKRVFSWLLTFICVNSAFVMFRADTISTAFEIYRGMLGFNGAPLPSMLGRIINSSNSDQWLQINAKSGIEFLMLLLICFFIVLCLPSSSSLTPESEKNKSNIEILDKSYMPILIGFLFVLSIISFNKTSTFLYFEF
jgi:alginate O-acetyltransferase complex protein AlgI